jgi:hypothetical protein
MAKVRAFSIKIWSAVTCHRFRCWADWSAQQSRVQRLGGTPRRRTFDGDKSPAQSADQSAHSKVQRLQLHRAVSIV